MTVSFKLARSIAAALLFTTAMTVHAEDPKPIRIGLVSFLSGPAAGPFGVPAKNAAEAVVESLNAGKAPPPYNTKGFGGVPIALTIIDEAGGVTAQVSEFRNLVERSNVDYVIGYDSSGDCLAIAPVAEEMKKLTILRGCGTPRVFEERTYKYVFRTRPHATMDAVGAALYLLDVRPDVANFTGINQNYAWGQDSWNDFTAAMTALKPSVKITPSQMPKLGAGQYGAEISALLASNSEVIHSSLWGGDLEAFMLQASPRALFQKSQLILTAGEAHLARLGSNMPEGVIVGGRGTHGVFAPDSALKGWLREIYKAKSGGVEPSYPSYETADAFLGLKAAFEKARATKANPTPEDIIAAFEHLTFDSPSGKISMSLGKGHQASTGTAYGTTKVVNGQVTLVNIKRYSADRVQPPDGVASVEWIKTGMKPSK